MVVCANNTFRKIYFLKSFIKFPKSSHHEEYRWTYFLDNTIVTSLPPLILVHTSFEFGILIGFKIINWKLIPNNVPKSFLFATPSRSSNKFNIDMEERMKSSLEDQFLEDLRTAVKNRGANSKIRDISKFLAEKVEQEVPQLPPRPNYKKSMSQYKESHLENPKSNDLLCEVPHAQGEVLNPVDPKQTRRKIPLPKIQKPLPEIPAEEPEEQVKRAPFSIKQHYIRQRIEDRGLKSSNQNFPKIPIQSSSSAATQTLSKEATSKPGKIKPSKILPETVPSELSKLEESAVPDKRFNSIPRPPNNFPKLVINDGLSSNLSETLKPIPAELESK